MAIRARTFYDIGLDEIWKAAIADDLSLSYAVKKNKMRVISINDELRDIPFKANSSKYTIKVVTVIKAEEVK